jgi:hypothetical protein
MMMTLPKRLLAPTLLCFAIFCGQGVRAQNTMQTLSLAGLRSVAMQGQINAIKTDTAGDLFLLLNQGDGVRLLKTDNTGATVQAQALLGAKGDIGLALALDSSGNIYVTGTTTSSTLTGTSGAAIPNRTDQSTNSFVAKFDANLNLVFVTFTGASKIAASALAVTADSVFVTGVTYASNLPVTPSGIQQAPALGSSGNGFVERFNSAGSTLVYASYLTGASGDTTPAAIAADAADNAYIAGSTTASGFPTVAALVPAILSNPSGFLTKLTPAGDNFLFSTFIPGGGLSSLALDTTGSSLLASGSVALGQFPVDTVSMPLAPLTYQVLLRLPLDGSGVTNGVLLAPGSQSFVGPQAGGAVWVAGALSAPLLPVPALAGVGTVFAERVTAANTIDQTARFGGLPNGNATYASLPITATGIAVDPGGEPLIAGSVAPTASSSLLSSETYDLPLRNAPTAAFPSTVTGAEQTAATCNGSLCAGSAAYLGKLDPAVNTSALTLSGAAAPFIVVRNLGSAAASGLTISATGSTVSTNCPTTLAAGAECDALLAGGAAGTLTATAGADTQTLTFAAYAAPASTIVFYPKELDFGIQTSTSASGQRVFTVSNLGRASQTFTSAIDSSAKTASPFTQVATDCTSAGTTSAYLLAPGGSCHVTLAFTAPSTPSTDGFLQAEWSVGGKDILLTGYSEAASLSPSVLEIDFGTQYSNGLRLARYLYLSNNSAGPLSHATLSLPASSPFTLTDACESTLLPQSVCRIRIDYQSTASTSSDSTTLTLDNGTTVLLTGQTLPPKTVTGSTVDPNLSVSPASVTFSAAVPVTGVSAGSQSISITNTGASAFPLTLSLTGDFSDQTSCGPTLAAGATCAVALTFVPSQSGTRQGLLAVTAGSSFTPFYVSITGTGSSFIASSNGMLNLGSSPVGEPTTQFYKLSQSFPALTAVTTGPFTIDLIEDNGYGHGSPPASAYSQSSTGACPDCFLAVQYTPTATGVQTGTLTLTSTPGGSPLVLSLTGTGTAITGLVLTPAAQDFGSIPVNSQGGAVLFTLTNLAASGSTITVTQPALTGDFVFVTTPTGGQACTGTLAYGASCLFQVAFAPAAAGIRAGTLSIGTSAGSVSAALTGTASADSGLAVAPLALSFNDTPGTASTQQTVTLTNTSGTTVQVGALSLSSPTFSVQGACATLAPGASCALTITFAPGSATVSGTLSIPATPVSPGATSTVYTVALAGTYTSTNVGLQIVPGVAYYGPDAVGVEGTLRLFTINNLTAKTFALTVSIPRQFVLSGAPCTTLAANGSCIFAVTFLPLTNGDIPGSITVQATPSDGSATLSNIAYAEGYGSASGSLSIFGGLIVNDLYSFGQVNSGTSATRVFTIANTSATASLTVRRVTSAPPFLATTTCGATLAPASTCSVTVTYTPQNQVSTGTTLPASTTDMGTLTIESDAASSPTSISLSGQAGPQAVAAPSNASALATFTLSQSSLTFQTTSVGNVSTAQSVVLVNTGNTNIHILALGATADYSITSACGTVVPGASCSVVVASTPQTAGSHIASLEIASDASTSLEFVSLISTGTPPALTLNPTTLNFGTVVLGSTSQLSLQATNNSATPVVFSSVTATGDYTPQAGSCPAAGGSLAPGQSCQLPVRFMPTATGTRTGTLSITTSAGTLPLTVSLIGIATQSKLTIAPSALSFGSLVVQASANLSVSITNNGTAPVNALSFAVSGDYSISQPCGVVALAPGAGCTLQITFSPTALGTRTGTLTVTSSDPASPASVPLTGTGIAAGSFTLTVNGGSSASVSVNSGAPASYQLALTPTGNFSGTVVLSCAAITPAQYASCSLAPASFTLNGTPASAVATINTITSINGNASLAAPEQQRRGPDTGTAFCFLLAPGMVLVWKTRRRLRRRLPVLLSLLFIAATLLASGCGSTSADPNARYSPVGTFQYQVTAVSTGGVQITQSVTLNLTITPR